ncbi:MAG: NUDIX hydrolase [Alphaproteobacteria bacterium]|jgi:8-oxo-dGTP pyrophosphatase MutT (NUDIX family)|nr:NUDIX hydrolase [Alphaproteobacteria bacterium]
MSDAVPILPAATILLVRDAPAFEVLMVKRHHQIDFASGALVFPGGKTARGDHDPAWERLSLGWDDSAPDSRPLRIAALREAYEETGILLARRADGSAFAGDEAAASARDDVAHDRRAFLDLVRDLGVKLDLSALSIFARWITPNMMPKRFDTWFFVAEAPRDQLALCDGWETVDAEWIPPADAIALGERGARKIIFPTRMNLQLLAEAQSAADAISRANSRRLVTVEPRVVEAPEGRVLAIPPDAGYGDVREPLANIA